MKTSLEFAVAAVVMTAPLAAQGRSGGVPREPPRREVLNAPPAWEWYRPTPDEAKAAGPAMAEHARKGGLFIRARG